jgi:hypothetical protein
MAKQPDNAPGKPPLPPGRPPIATQSQAAAIRPLSSALQRLPVDVGLFVNSDYIDVSPEEVRACIGTDKTISILQHEKRDNLMRSVSAMQGGAPIATAGEVVLYRFCSGDRDGLQSEAEKHGQQAPVPPDVLDRFADQHTRQNVKVMTDERDGATYRSPLVSTTEDLRAFVCTSFTPRVGDTNLRQNVFNNAPYISVMVVPEVCCRRAPPLKRDMRDGSKPDIPLLEKEVCYNTDHGDLSRYERQKISNPFQGQVAIDPEYVVISRGPLRGVDYAVGARDLRRQNAEIPKDQPITPEIAVQYEAFYHEKADFCRMVRSDIGKPPLAPSRVSASAMDDHQMTATQNAEDPPLAEAAAASHRTHHAFDPAIFRSAHPEQTQHQSNADASPATAQSQQNAKGRGMGGRQ